jgi:hypothetical protein
MASSSCQCETLRMYLLFNMYMVYVLFVLCHSFLSHRYNVMLFHWLQISPFYQSFLLVFCLLIFFLVNT